MSSVKREIRHFNTVLHVVVVQCDDKEMYKKDWCRFKVVIFCNNPIAYFFDVVTAVAVVDAKAPQ